MPRPAKEDVESRSGRQAEAGRQPLLLRQAPDETQALDFVAKVMDWDHLNQ